MVYYNLCKQCCNNEQSHTQCPPTAITLPNVPVIMALCVSHPNGYCFNSFNCSSTIELWNSPTPYIIVLVRCRVDLTNDRTHVNCVRNGQWRLGKLNNNGNAAGVCLLPYTSYKSKSRGRRTHPTIFVVSRVCKPFQCNQCPSRWVTGTFFVLFFISCFRHLIQYYDVSFHLFLFNLFCKNYFMHTKLNIFENIN